MENYPRLFIKAGLIYALIGAVLGMAMAIEPSLSGRIRFVHIHLNLLGFMTMFVAGVAFHVLPRFNARPVPWPEGVKYQFYLQNIGLIGMMAMHVSGVAWKGGGFRALFILFAVSAGIAIFFMFYNLYFVLSPAKSSEPPGEITKDMKVAAVLDQFPQTMPVFMQNGFTSLANPAARRTFAKVVSIEKACEKHDVDCAEFLTKINAVLSGKPQSPSPATPAPAQRDKPAGKEIQKGETCQADTRVGSLIKAYPETKPVFEKHYGEGCFSCPGQVFETVQETAHMHNIDPGLILNEINQVIAEKTRKQI
ncbi:MAG: hypothetical protein NPINA01_07430 [Nitrospinaceae bacterium]|nr:MAG: hypothetical protein NPINA01_07430 [Nitrospinaceae bacterium]